MSRPDDDTQPWELALAGLLGYRPDPRTGVFNLPPHPFRFDGDSVVVKEVVVDHSGAALIDPNEPNSVLLIEGRWPIPFGFRQPVEASVRCQANLTLDIDSIGCRLPEQHEGPHRDWGDGGLFDWSSAGKGSNRG